MRAHRAGRLARTFLLAAACIGAGATASAQTFIASRPPAETGVRAGDAGRQTPLEARVRQLEGRIAALSRQIARLPARSSLPATAETGWLQPARPAPRTDMPAPVEG